jgi:hypothetical protein
MERDGSSLLPVRISGLASATIRVRHGELTRHSAKRETA